MTAASDKIPGRACRFGRIRSVEDKGTSVDRPSSSSAFSKCFRRHDDVGGAEWARIAASCFSLLLFVLLFFFFTFSVVRTDCAGAFVARLLRNVHVESTRLSAFSERLVGLVCRLGRKRVAARGDDDREHLVLRLCDRVATGADCRLVRGSGCDIDACVLFFFGLTHGLRDGFEQVRDEDHDISTAYGGGGRVPSGES